MGTNSWYGKFMRSGSISLKNNHTDLCIKFPMILDFDTENQITYETCTKTIYYLHIFGKSLFNTQMD